MTRIVVETAALADAVKKADQIAPTTGEAFDKAAGILFEVSPMSTTPLIIKATNLDIYSMEWMDVIESSGDATAWRLPSRLFSAVISSLPIGSTSVVVLEEKKEGVYKQVHLTCGKTKARFYLMDEGYYPHWSAFDPTTLSPVANFGGRLKQVEWAAAKIEVPLCGVHFDGEYCVATDKYKLARAPLPIAHLTDPITVPSGILAAILKQSTEVQVGFEGSQLLIMPDEHSQLRAIIFGLGYPNLQRALSAELPNSFTVRKEPMLTMIQRANAFAGSDRMPRLRCFLGKEEFAVMMKNDEIGLLGDILELPGQLLHDRIEVSFTPKNFTEPISNAPSEEITIFYDPDNNRAPFKIDGGSGYEAWVMPRLQTEA